MLSVFLYPRADARG